MYINENMKYETDNSQADLDQPPPFSHEWRVNMNLPTYYVVDVTEKATLCQYHYSYSIEVKKKSCIALN